MRADAVRKSVSNAVLDEDDVPAVVEDDGREGDGLQERGVVLEIRLGLGTLGDGSRLPDRCPPAWYAIGRSPLLLMRPSRGALILLPRYKPCQLSWHFMPVDG